MRCVVYAAATPECEKTRPRRRLAAARPPSWKAPRVGTGSIRRRPRPYDTASAKAGFRSRGRGTAFSPPMTRSVMRPLKRLVRVQAHTAGPIYASCRMRMRAQESLRESRARAPACTVVLHRFRCVIILQCKYKKIWTISTHDGQP